MIGDLFVNIRFVHTFLAENGYCALPAVHARTAKASALTEELHVYCVIVENGTLHTTQTR